MTIYGSVIGFLSTAPERKTIGSWQAVEVNIISSSGYNQSRVTTMVTCLGFAKVGEALGRLLKGEQVSLSGELYHHIYKNSSGQEHKILKMDVKNVTYLTGVCGGSVKKESEPEQFGSFMECEDVPF